MLELYLRLRIKNWEMGSYGMLARRVVQTETPVMVQV